jgi:hypothetical protein
MAGFVFYKTRDGLAPEMGTIVAHEAIKQGDVITPYASDLDQADRMDDAAEYALGVAAGGAGAGADCLYYKANYNNLFVAQTEAAKEYDASADRFTTCDLSVFTSGAMAIDCTADTNHQVRLLDLAPGETDDTSGNKAIVMFNLRSEG